MQVVSQRWSQTWPRIDGSGLSPRVRRTASAKSPSRTAFMYCGTFWSTGHSSTHGASMQSNSPSSREVLERSVRNEPFW